MNNRIIVRTTGNLSFAGLKTDVSWVKNAYLVELLPQCVYYIIPYSECCEIIENKVVSDIQSNQDETVDFKSCLNIGKIAIRLSNTLTFFAEIIGTNCIENDEYYLCCQSSNSRITLLIRSNAIEYALTLHNDKVNKDELKSLLGL